MAGKPVPKRICRDPQTKYCIGHKNSRKPWGHRGCCECWVYNNESKEMDGYPVMECNPYLLPEEVAKLKIWWMENDMGPWKEDWDE
jgi:hypothetical protein